MKEEELEINRRLFELVPHKDKYVCTTKEIIQEIERLKQMKLNTEKHASEMEDKYILEKIKNEKVIKYIEENCILSDCWEDLGFCNFVPIGRIKYKSLSSKKVKYLLDILKGVDK